MPHQQITLAALRSLLTARWEGAAFWTQDEADRAIARALRQYNLATGLWKRRLTLPTEANQVYYALPSALLHSLRVEWNEYPVHWEAPDAMDRWRQGWKGETTATGRPVPTKVTKWVPVGIYTLAIWPADAAGGNGLLIDGVADTPTLTLPGDYLDLEQTDLDALLAYALQTVAFKGPRDRWRQLWPAALKTFYQAAARHNPRLATIPALASYFPEQADDRRSTRPPVTRPGDAAANVEARP